MPDIELFMATPVELRVPEEDSPGQPVSRVTCENCGEDVAPGCLPGEVAYRCSSRTK